MITKLLNSIIDNIIYPRLCISCGKFLSDTENHLCFECISKLPKTKYHHWNNNFTVQLLAGRINFRKATSYAYFSKGGVLQKIIHDFKYNGNIDLAEELGKMYGYELYEYNFITDIDMLIPIPLHPAKLMLRGYNQSEAIANGISQVTGLPVVTDVVKRVDYTETQTKKGRTDRWINVKDAFKVEKKSNIANKHVLLIDDVITTGATLEACANAIIENQDISVSVATLAIAKT